MPTSRYVRGYITVGEPDTDTPPTECPTCGYDAVLAFPLTLLTPNGVTPFGYRLACCRCWEQQTHADQ